MNKKLRILFCAEDYGSLEQNLFLIKLLAQKKLLNKKKSLFICNNLFRNKIEQKYIPNNFFFKDINKRNKKKITQKDNEKMKLSLANNQIGNMINNSYKVGDFIIISEIIKGTEIKVVRNLLDEIRNKEIYSLCLLFCEIDKKNVLFVSCASKLIEKNIFANDLAKKIIDFAGGKGGGKKESAQIGGIDFSKVNDIKLFVEKLVRI